MAKRTPMYLTLLGVAVLAIAWVWAILGSRLADGEAASMQVAQVASEWRTHSTPDHGLLIVTVLREEDLTPIKGARVIPLEGVLSNPALKFVIRDGHAETDAGEILPAPLTNPEGIAWIDFESGRTIKIVITTDEPWGVGEGPYEGLIMDVAPLIDGEVRTRNALLLRRTDGLWARATQPAGSNARQVSVITSPNDGPAEFGAWVPLSDRPLPQPDTLAFAFWRNGRYMIGLSCLGVKAGEVMTGTTTPENVGRLIDHVVAEFGSVREQRDPINLEAQEVRIYARRGKEHWSLTGPASALRSTDSVGGDRTITERVVRLTLAECKNIDLAHATTVAYWDEMIGFDPTVFAIARWPQRR